MTFREKKSTKQLNRKYVVQNLLATARVLFSFPSPAVNLAQYLLLKTNLKHQTLLCYVIFRYVCLVTAVFLESC